MKKIFGLLILTVLGLCAQAQDRIAEKEIQGPVIRLFDGISAVDKEAVKAEISNDFILLENGKIWNTDSLVKAISRYKGLGLTRVNKLEFIKTEQIGNVAWVSYHNTAEMELKGRKMTARWMESAVLVKQGSVWRIKLLHSTVLKTAGAAQE